MPIRTDFDTNNLAAAANVHLGALRDLLGKGKDKFDFGADFKLSFGEEVETCMADVASLRAEFAAARFEGKHPERKTHRKSPGNAPFRSISHSTLPDRD